MAINNKTTFNPDNSEFRNRKEIDNLSIKNVVTIPEDIHSLEKIGFLHVSFLKDIIIPDELTKIKITNLELNGLITTEEELKITKLFPGTKLTINGQ